MKFLKKAVLPFFIFVICVCLTHALYAQPVDPCVDPFEPCPIDDNVILLIFAVVLFAIYKAVLSYKQKLAN